MSVRDSPKAVFLSYASQDAEAAKRICEALRSAGIEVWFDQSELRGGDAWDRQIRKQIHDCALFVPVISANSQARLEGYFRLEWRLAVERTHLMADEKPFLVPVVTDDTKDQDAHVPDAFRAVQWSRLPGGATPPSFAERVSRLVSPNEAQKSPAAQTTMGPPNTVQQTASTRVVSRRAGQVLLLVSLAVAVVGASYFVVDKVVLSKSAPGRTQSTVRADVAVQNTIPEKSIAVLPFVDLSEQHDQEYFVDGMAEEILNLLVKIPELKVIGRTSSFQFKGKADDLRKIGTTLGAAYVVEGSVRRFGDHIRVTAQLIDSRDGAHRWSETYDRNTNDILQVQGEIAASLVRALQLEVTAADHGHSASLKNMGAYDSYLRGLHALNRYDQRGFEEAVVHFKHALQVDPTFTAAAEQLARAFADQADFGYVPPQTANEQARAAAQQALTLDPRSALGHVLLGAVYGQYDWDWAAAEREITTAVQLGPNNPLVCSWASDQRVAVGQWTDALHFIDAAIAADPLNATFYWQRGRLYARDGRLLEAEGDARRASEISPTYEGARNLLVIALVLQGKPDSALVAIQGEASAFERSFGLALVYHAMRRTKEADAELARFVKKHTEEGALDIAGIYAFRGEKDEAFKWLDIAFAQKEGVWRFKSDVLLKSLDGDPRYKAFLRKLNLPE